MWLSLPPCQDPVDEALTPYLSSREWAPACHPDWPIHDVPSPHGHRISIPRQYSPPFPPNKLHRRCGHIRPSPLETGVGAATAAPQTPPTPLHLQREEGGHTGPAGAPHDLRMPILGRFLRTGAMDYGDSGADRFPTGFSGLPRHRRSDAQCFELAHCQSPPAALISRAHCHLLKYKILI